MRPTITLVLGGARGGKSAWAEARAAASGQPVVYLATATAADAEMADRIAAHQERRPPGWRTVEEPLDLAAAVRAQARPGDLVLIDCLTLWVSNRLLAASADYPDPDAAPAALWSVAEAALLAAADDLLAAGRERGADLLLVSNEVGLGIVPAYALGRRYRDALGRVNQRVAAQADPVVLMIAGLPVDLRRLLVAPTPPSEEP